MSFLVALNTISMGFLVALITHSMNLFVALKRDFQRELRDLWYAQQMQTYCERKKIHGTVPLRGIIFDQSCLVNPFRNPGAYGEHEGEGQSMDGNPSVYYWIWNLPINFLVAGPDINLPWDIWGCDPPTSCPPDRGGEAFCNSSMFFLEWRKKPIYANTITESEHILIITLFHVALLDIFKL